MTTAKTTVISEELKELIDEAASSFVSLGQLWSQIKEKGIEEGHTEKELHDIIASRVKKALPADLTPQQVKKKLWYVFHSEEQKARVNKSKNGGTNISTAAKKDPEESSIPTQPFTSGDDNVEYLKNTIAMQEDTITKLRAEIVKLSEPDEEYQNNMAELEALRTFKEIKSKETTLEPGEKRLGPFRKGFKLYDKLAESVANVESGEWPGFWIVVDGSKVTAYVGMK